MNTETILYMCNIMLTHAKATANPVHLSNLNRVRFEVNTNLTSCAGRAYTGVRTVEGIGRGELFGLVQISLPIFERTPCMAELVETILHEIAHIMVPDAGHKLPWILAAKSIGSTGTRCHSMKKGYTKQEKKKLANAALLESL